MSFKCAILAGVRMVAEDMKTNAARLLETLRVPHEIREYQVDPDDLTAGSVAAKIGLPSPEQVFKTLVVKGDRAGVCLAVVPEIVSSISEPWRN